jgi:hypothetical protein
MTEDTNIKRDGRTPYQGKCASFLKISEKIRYVGIINRFGRTITGKLKEGIKPLLTPEQARDERYIEAARQQLRKALSTTIGKSVFTIEKNENVTFLLVPDEIQGIFYYITIEKDTPLAEIEDIINKVFEITSHR